MSNKTDSPLYPNRYSELSDRALLQHAKQGDRRAEETLIERYEYLARIKARSYFMAGADREDTIQEGMIGLFKAIRDYKESELCSFRSFAILCVTRQIITAVKTHARKKHTPLSQFQALDDMAPEVIMDNFSLNNGNNQDQRDPLDMIIMREEVLGCLSLHREKLSNLEWYVFVHYLDGQSYQEIAENLNCESKVVDNALYRVKQKTKQECALLA